MAQNGSSLRFNDSALSGTARVHGISLVQPPTPSPVTLALQQQQQQQPLLPLPVGSSSNSGVLSRSPPATMAPPLPLSTALQSGAGSVPPSPGSTLDRDFITLSQPRPGIARTRNEYIDTPLRPQQASGLAVAKLPPAKTLSSVRRPRTCPSIGVGTAGAALLPHQHPSSRLVALHPPGFPSAMTGSAAGHHHFQHRLAGGTVVSANAQHRPILTQPCVTSSFKSGTLKKGKAAEEDNGTLARPGGGPTEADADSIICQQCGLCKCDACRSPRPLPQSWICGKKYQCSADTTLDYCTCMCCVKGVFYHCAKDEDCDDGSELACADRPCSCAPHRRWARWGCLGALSLLLPCLLCYLPMRGCLQLCQMCYTRYHSRGCRCLADRRKDGAGSVSSSSSPAPSTAATTPGSDAATTPTKLRLLDSSDAGEC